MSWRHVEVDAERVRFVQEAVAGQRSFSALCASFGITRPTGYLAMQTPASCWHPIFIVFTGPREPNYARDAEVRLLNPLRALSLNGRNWQVAGALAHQPVRLDRFEDRILVFYATTLLREINLAGSGFNHGRTRSSQPTQSVKHVMGQNVKDVPGLDSFSRALKCHKIRQALAAEVRFWSRQRLFPQPVQPQRE